MHTTWISLIPGPHGKINQQIRTTHQKKSQLLQTFSPFLFQTQHQLSTHFSSMVGKTSSLEQ